MTLEIGKHYKESYFFEKLLKNKPSWCGIMTTRPFNNTHHSFVKPLE